MISFCKMNLMGILNTNSIILHFFFWKRDFFPNLVLLITFKKIFELKGLSGVQMGESAVCGMDLYYFYFKEISCCIAMVFDCSTVSVLLF